MFFRRKVKKPAELRKHYRRTLDKKHGLGVTLYREGAEPTSGEVVDLSAGGTCIAFEHAKDPGLSESDPVAMVFSSLVQGHQVTAHARTCNVQENAGRLHYGFEFTDPEGLMRQLDVFYLKFFNRRGAERVRPALGSRFPVEIEHEGNATKASVDDISQNGMGFYLDYASAAQIAETSSIRLCFKIPRTQVEVRVDAEIRHRSSFPKGVLHGITFAGMDKKSSAALAEYIESRRKEIAAWNAA